MTARSADPFAARHLDVEIGAPLLCFMRVPYSAEREPISYLRGLFRPDRYEIELDLEVSTMSQTAVWHLPAQNGLTQPHTALYDLDSGEGDPPGHRACFPRREAALCSDPRRSNRARRSGLDNPPHRPGRRPGRGPQPQPLYFQIYAQLRQMLVDHPQDPDRPLPAEPELARRFGVSRVTIRKTLEQLQRDGLILRVHGKGTYPAAPHPGQDKRNISGSVDNLLSIDPRSGARTLFWEMVDAAPEIATQLSSPRCLRVVRLRLLNEVPQSLTTLHVPETLAPLVAGEEDQAEPLIRVLERKGVLTERAEQVLTAIPAGPDIAALLDLPAGNPVMLMRRLMFDHDQRPVLHQESSYPSDRFEYRMTLSRFSLGRVAQWTPLS